jgi:hypothetical protein
MNSEETMKNRTLFIICLIALCCAQGCIVVRPAADTIISVACDGIFSSEQNTMGLKHVAWAESDDAIIIVGYGRHPREHETYAFFISEPYPVRQPRSIRIVTKKNIARTDPECTIEFLLDSSLNPCHVDSAISKENYLFKGASNYQPSVWFDKLSFKLHNIALINPKKPDEKITVTGTITAKKKTLEEVISLSDQFEASCKSAEF